MVCEEFDDVCVFVASLFLHLGYGAKKCIVVVVLILVEGEFAFFHYSNYLNFKVFDLIFTKSVKCKFSGKYGFCFKDSFAPVNPNQLPGVVYFVIQLAVLMMMVY